MFPKQLFWSFLYQSVRQYARSSAVKETDGFVVPTFRLASQWPERTAITDEFGDYTYKNLLFASKTLASQLTKILDGKTQERIAFLCPNNVNYVIAQWACWISGNIGRCKSCVIFSFRYKLDNFIFLAVPLCCSHPQEMLEYFVNDSDSCLILGTEKFKERIEQLSEKTGAETKIISDSPLDTINK